MRPRLSSKPNSLWTVTTSSSGTGSKNRDFQAFPANRSLLTALPDLGFGPKPELLIPARGSPVLLPEFTGPRPGFVPNASRLDEMTQLLPQVFREGRCRCTIVSSVTFDATRVACSILRSKSRGSSL